jgi:hypothetical protein
VYVSSAISKKNAVKASGSFWDNALLVISK